MIRLAATILFLTMTTNATANCKDDLAAFRKAEHFGAHSFTCKDGYDGRTTSSWKMDTENYKLYRQWLRQSKMRKKK